MTHDAGTPELRALYVSHDGALDPLGGSQVVPIVEGLARRGVRMGLLSYEKPERLVDRDRVTRTRKRLEAAGAEWRPLRYHRRPPLLSTAVDVVRGVRAARAMSVWPPHLLHARSYVGGVIARRLAGDGGAAPGGERRDEAERPIPFLFDMRGFWVDERIEAGLWRPRGLVTRLARRFERKLLEDAGGLVLLTEAAMGPLSELHGSRPLPPAWVVPTCVDLERFRPATDRAAARRELGLGDGPVVVYAGSLSTWYLPELTLRVGQAFVTRTSGRFAILTHEAGFAAELCARLGVSALIRSVPSEEVPRWLGASDAGLCFVRPSWAKRASAPTKVGEYLGSGLAVAATAGVGDLDSHFDGSPIAFTVPPDEDPEAIADRLVVATRRDTRMEEARSLGEERYDLRRGIETYASLYRELAGRERSGQEQPGPEPSG